MSLVDALLSVTNVYAQVQNIVSKTVLQERQAAETEFREVIMSAMDVLISERTTPNPTKTRAQKDSKGISDLLKYLQGQRYGNCPDPTNDQQYSTLCRAYTTYLAALLKKDNGLGSFDRLKYLFDNVGVSFMAIYNSFSASLGDMLVIEAAPASVFSDPHKYAQYCKRAVFRLMEHLLAQLPRLKNDEPRLVIRYLEMRFFVADQHSSTREALKADFEFWQKYYEVGVRNSEPNPNKIVHYTTRRNQDFFIQQTLLNELDVNTLSDVTLEECIFQLRNEDRTSKDSEKRKLDINNEIIGAKRLHYRDGS